MLTIRLAPPNIFDAQGRDGAERGELRVASRREPVLGGCIPCLRARPRALRLATLARDLGAVSDPIRCPLWKRQAGARARPLRAVLGERPAEGAAALLPSLHQARSRTRSAETRDRDYGARDESSAGRGEIRPLRPLHSKRRGVARHRADAFGASLLLLHSPRAFSSRLVLCLCLCLSVSLSLSLSRLTYPLPSAPPLPPPSAQIYEAAISELPDAQIKDMCLRFAEMERRLGEIDRARAIFQHGSQFCEPGQEPGYWDEWRAFEVNHGNEDTFRDMLRVKRAVQAQCVRALLRSLRV